MFRSSSLSSIGRLRHNLLVVMNSFQSGHVRARWYGLFDLIERTHDVVHKITEMITITARSSTPRTLLFRRSVER